VIALTEGGPPVTHFRDGPDGRLGTDPVISILAA